MVILLADEPLRRQIGELCWTEHLCGGNNPLSLVVVGVSARTFLSLWACAARLPFGFSSWNFGDDSPCFMPVRQVSESRYHDFLRRSWNFGDDSPCFMPVRQVSESRYHDFLRRSSQQFLLCSSRLARWSTLYFFFPFATGPCGGRVTARRGVFCATFVQF